MTTLVTTPDATAAQSPAARTVAITEAQKQALMDNLQLEIADRARKLRAQYALQAQGLRTRLEMRINRIPRDLRRANMGDLLQKHLQPEQKTLQRLPSPVKSKSLKRKSEEVPAADKENTQPASATLPNPKKRSKPNPVPTSIPTSPNLPRSKRPQPLNPTVLSPKSPNSRTLPRSPLKSPASTKSPPPLPRPRATATQQSAQAAKSRQTKRPATAPTSNALDSVVSVPQPPTATRRAARNSNASDNSTSSEKTTIVNKSPAKPSAPPARPHTAMAAPASKKLPVPTAVARQDKEKPLPAPSPAPTPATGTVKKGTFKSAMASLTGSKKVKKATAAAAFASGTPPPAGRVLRKRAP